jgi:hypothetical protein
MSQHCVQSVSAIDVALPVEMVTDDKVTPARSLRVYERRTAISAVSTIMGEMAAACFILSDDSVGCLPEATEELTSAGVASHSCGEQQSKERRVCAATTMDAV